MKILRYILINGLLLFILLYSFYNNNIMPQNIALSIYWITSIIGTLFIFISDSFIQKIKQSDVSFSVSKEIDALFDILIVLLFINLGLVYLPIFYFTHIIGLYTLRKRLNK